MIQQLFDTELDKKLQKVNWGLRPMKPEQLHYAANDVLYLLQMKAVLEQQAAEKNMINGVTFNRNRKAEIEEKFFSDEED